MNLYSIDVSVVATAYIKANSEEEALTIARKEFENQTMDLPEGGWVSGRMFDDPRLPEASLSPAVTLGSLLGGVCLAEENIPEGEDDF